MPNQKDPQNPTSSEFSLHLRSILWALFWKGMLYLEERAIGSTNRVLTMPITTPGDDLRKITFIDFHLNDCCSNTIGHVSLSSARVYLEWTREDSISSNWFSSSFQNLYSETIIRRITKYCGNIILRLMALYLISEIDSGLGRLYNQYISPNDHI